MRRGTNWAVYGFAWLTAGFGPPDAGLLSCHGSFGQFAAGALVAKPSEVEFIVDWKSPAITTSSGRAGKITAWTPLTLAFDIAYADYTASYRVDRMDGSITQAGELGSLFRGECELRPLSTRF